MTSLPQQAVVEARLERARGMLDEVRRMRPTSAAAYEPALHRARLLSADIRDLVESLPYDSPANQRWRDVRDALDSHLLAAESLVASGATSDAVHNLMRRGLADVEAGLRAILSPASV